MSFTPHFDHLWICPGNQTATMEISFPECVCTCMCVCARLPLAMCPTSPDVNFISQSFIVTNNVTHKQTCTGGFFFSYFRNSSLVWAVCRTTCKVSVPGMRVPAPSPAGERAGSPFVLSEGKACAANPPCHSGRKSTEWFPLWNCT